MQRIIEALSHDSLTAGQRENPQPPWSWSEDGLLLHDKLIYIPQNDELRLEILKMHHDDPLTGHFGVPKTFELLSRNYWFPSMHRFIKSYVSTCDLCLRSKPSRHLPHSELAALPIPSGPWKSLSVDFIVDLPDSHGFNAILVFVDRFTKMVHFVPCTKFTDGPTFCSNVTGSRHQAPQPP